MLDLGLDLKKTTQNTRVWGTREIFMQTFEYIHTYTSHKRYTSCVLIFAQSMILLGYSLYLQINKKRIGHKDGELGQRLTALTALSELELPL